MTRKSKKLRDRAVCPRRRGGLKVKPVSKKMDFHANLIENSVDAGLGLNIFIGKVC